MDVYKFSAILSQSGARLCLMVIERVGNSMHQRDGTHNNSRLRRGLTSVLSRSSALRARALSAPQSPDLQRPRSVTRQHRDLSSRSSRYALSSSQVPPSATFVISSPISIVHPLPAPCCYQELASVCITLVASVSAQLTASRDLSTEYFFLLENSLPLHRRRGLRQHLNNMSIA